MVRELVAFGIEKKICTSEGSLGIGWPRLSEKKMRHCLWSEGIGWPCLCNGE